MWFVKFVISIQYTHGVTKIKHFNDLIPYKQFDKFVDRMAYCNSYMLENSKEYVEFMNEISNLTMVTTRQFHGDNHWNMVIDTINTDKLKIANKFMRVTYLDDGVMETSICNDLRDCMLPNTKPVSVELCTISNSMKFTTENMN